jgi:MFS family permease
MPLHATPHHTVGPIGSSVRGPVSPPDRVAEASRRVRPLLAATGVSVIGGGAFLTAAPLLAASLTRSPIGVSAVTAAIYMPWLLFGLPAGALVDRWRRRTVMILADVTRAVLLGALTVLVIGHRVNLGNLILIVIAVGVAQTFFDAAAQAHIPAAVGRDKEVLAHVNGRFWALDTVGRSLLGPPLGSLMFVVRHASPFAMNAVSFVVSALLVRRLPKMPPPTGAHGSIGAAIHDGLRHLMRVRDLRLLAFCTGAYNFGYSAATATFVLYVTDVLRVAEGMYGVFVAAGAVGGVCVGWQARAIMRRVSYRTTMPVVMLGQALGWIALAISRDPWAAGITFVLIGGCGAICSVTVGSVRHALTPDGLLGRVVTAYRFFSVGAAGLGALAGGLIADLFDATAPLVAAAGVLVGATVATWPLRGRD